MKIKSFLVPAVLLSAILPAAGQLFVIENYNFPVGGSGGDVADDGSSSGFSQTITTSQIVQLTEVKLGLNLAGNPVGNGFASDMFVSLNLNFGNQTAILLNQVGLSGSDPLGASYDGWNVTFQDSAANGDIHIGLPAGLDTLLTGIWQPDGRTLPGNTERPNLLGVFNGSTGNGDWHLTLADLAPGGAMRLESWSLTLTGAPVPEPETYAVVAGAALLGFAAWRRNRAKSTAVGNQ